MVCGFGIGDAGNAIVTPRPAPASFYISPRDGQLYQMINHTSVLHVNVLNTTSAPAPRSAFALLSSSSSSDTVQHPLGSAYAQARLELALAPGTPHNPLKLEMSSRKAQGSQLGTWKWTGSMLYYEDRAGRTNSGVYYQCMDRDGPHGLYMFLAPSPTPAGCQMVTLHRWVTILLLGYRMLIICLLVGLVPDTVERVVHSFSLFESFLFICIIILHLIIAWAIHIPSIS